MSPESYRQQLLAPIRPRELAPRAAALTLPGSIWFRPRREERSIGLRDLYDTGVRCGHGETRALLEARIASFDSELYDARARLSEVSARLTGDLTRTRAELAQARRAYDEHERELQGAVDGARARIRELEQSTFWRMTFPLRVTLHRGKVASALARRLFRHGGLLWPRLATARQIAKDEGVVELLRRMRAKLRMRAGPAALRPRGGLEAAIEPLRVASSEAPRISVIIPTFGQDLHTFTCLKALALEATRVPIEVIVMDDCAPVPAAQALASVEGVRFERNETNMGFLRNCNRGAALARGEFVLLLNNDAVLRPGALEALLEVFERHPEAGAAGAKLVYPDGRLQEAGAIVWRDGSAWNYGRGDNPDRPEYNYLRETDYCSAACLLVPARLFRELDGFDEAYLPAYYEDVDLCFRLREAGRKVFYQPAAEAVHFEGASHGTDTGEGIKRHQVDNQVRFRERWKERLAGHRANGLLPRVERDRDARRRVLIVEACMITPDQDAGSVRAWRLMHAMRDMGCHVSFVAANLERREPYVSRLQQAGVEVLHAPFVRSVEELIQERGSEFDVIVLARYYIATRYIDAVRRHAPRALLVFDTIDLHYLRNRRLAQLEKSGSLAQGAEAIHRQEIDCIERCDVTWVVSDAERDILEREVPRATVLVQTLIHEAAGSRVPFAQREGLLFVGGYRHPPNVDAALYLVREIVPLLRERLPGVPVYMVGSNSPKAILDLAGSGVEVLGHVPDLEPWFERCRVSVSPLRYGAGVKGKVIYAMSHGLPVVATRASIEGMHLVEGEEVLLGDDAASFADAVVRLYRDEALWNRLSLAGAASVDRHFSPAVAGRSLRQLFDIVDRRSGLHASPGET